MTNHKPFYQSRKLQTSVVTILSAMAILYFGPEKGELYAGIIVMLGSLLVGALGLEDHGKEAKRIELSQASELAALLQQAQELAAGKSEEEEGAAEAPEETEQGAEE